LRGEQIPIEARIVAAADVFDSLTSVRPYKTAWTNDEAFTLLREMAGKTLDADCVAALAEQRGEVERLQTRFRDPATA
jgi:HD-GYP domain-containing protein (c-di-GMP phosphodiesterase class II)